MAEKDLSEKLLEDYNDVFADIINVLLFDGKEVIKPDELEPAATVSQYKADDSKLHEQERDVAKYWKKGGLCFAFLGLENQTKVDHDIPFRVVNYDGVVYRSQMLSSDKHRYPVITIVLYYGTEHWNGPLSVYDALNISDDLKKYVNDSKVTLFEISYLPDSTLKKFKSDFGIVADFFVGKRRYKNYRPTDQRKFTHVDEMLKFLSVMTGDRRYEMVVPEIAKKGDLTMCDVLDRAINEGKAEGIKEGIKEGKAEGRKEIITFIMDSMNKMHQGNAKDSYTYEEIKALLEKADK